MIFFSPGGVHPDPPTLLDPTSQIFLAETLLVKQRQVRQNIQTHRTYYPDIFCQFCFSFFFVVSQGRNRPLTTYCMVKFFWSGKKFKFTGPTVQSDLELRPKKNIWLFPICCHFNQWVGREFILFFIFCYFNQSVGKKYFLFYLAPNSLPCMSYLYIT